MGKILPLVLALAGLGAGVGAGLVLRPNPSAEDDHASGEVVCPAPADGVEAMPAPPAGGPVEFVKFSNQFVVPVMSANEVEAMVILTLSLEVELGTQQEIYNLEPKIRDAFLRVLFDHANSGGFNGNFLNSIGLDTLRVALRETARKTAGAIVYDVLIVDLVRQTI
jgi:hypothetical protein